MTKPMIRIHDLSTDEIIDREMNDKEYADYQAQQAVDNLAAEAEAKSSIEKAALLEKLGISAEELKTLLH